MKTSESDERPLSEGNTKGKNEPLHSTLVIDSLMRWTLVNGIGTKDDLLEFLFRVAYIMDLNGLHSKIDSGNFIAAYGFRESKYRLTTDDLAKYIGYRCLNSNESYLPRESFLKSTFMNGFNAMMIAGKYGIELSVPKHFTEKDGEKLIVGGPENTPEYVASAEKIAMKLMKNFPAEVFEGKNLEFIKGEMALQPYTDHLPQVKLPRPTPADYKKREDILKMMKEGTGGPGIQDKELNLLNSFDWSHELTQDGELYGLKTALGEVLLPPLFENFTMMTNQELKKGDRVVTQQGGKWGVLLVDGKGTWIIKPEYDYIGYPNDVTHVCKNGKWGVLDIPKGVYIIEPDCETVFDNNGFLFCNRIGFYKKNGKYGVLGDWGAPTEPAFEEVDMEPEGNVRVKYNGEWGFIGEDNKFIAEEDEAYYYYSVD
jgi:hypothetical protein